MKHARLLCASAVCAALAFACESAVAKQPAAARSLLLAQSESPQRPLDVPYIATTPEVVNEMLRLGQVDKDDMLYDLGCGDGRIVIAAAKKYGARGVGVDIDPQRVREARANAAKEGVTDKVKFVQQDLFNTDLTGATVVTLYLLPKINLKLRPKLFRELKPGARVVSHNYDMGDWQPDDTITLGKHKVYMWTIRENAQGDRAKQD